MRIIGALLKPLSFIPAILIMYMIFSFSAQDGATSSQLSYKVSYKIVETGGKLLGEDWDQWQIESIATRFHGTVRKLAHMTEYFALAVSVAFPLYVYGMRGILLMFAAGLICIGFACGDEYHQSMVDGRSPSQRDIAIDSFGVLCGIILVRIVGWTGRKTIFRPFSKEHINKKKQKKALRMQQKEAYGASGGSYFQNDDYRSDGGYPQDGYYGSEDRYSQDAYYGPDGQYSRNSYYEGDNRYPQDHYYEPDGRYPQDGYYEPDGRYSNGGYYESDGRYPNGGYYESDDRYPQDPYFPPYDDRPQDDGYVPDKLSEDMSLKKLMHDLKEKKHEE